MCDCYEHKCQECSEYVPIHLANFGTGRNEIEVYCDKHIPVDTSDGVVWRWGDYAGDYSKAPSKTRRVFIRALTENAKAYAADGNEPNAWCESELVFGKSDTTIGAV